MHRDSLGKSSPDSLRPERCGACDEAAWLVFCERLRRELDACEWFVLRPDSRVSHIVEIARRASLASVRSVDVAAVYGNSPFFRGRFGDDDITGLAVSRVAVVDAMSGSAMETPGTGQCAGEALRSTMRLIGSALHAKDPRAHAHSSRVAMNSVLSGRILNLDVASLRELEAAALLHDIGKVGIDDVILQKPYNLTETEYSMIQDHPVIGAAMVQGLLPCDAVGELILHHHEDYDGSGYPHGLARDRIPRGARIIAVADAFDSMTMGRPYRTAVTVNEAVDELTRCSGTQFCPESVDAFVAALERSAGGVPVGSCTPEPWQAAGALAR